MTLSISKNRDKPNWGRQNSTAITEAIKRTKFKTTDNVVEMYPSYSEVKVAA